VQYLDGNFEENTNHPHYLDVNSTTIAKENSTEKLSSFYRDSTITYCQYFKYVQSFA